MVIVHSGSFEIQSSGKILKAGDCAAFKKSEDKEQYIRMKSLEDSSALILLAGQPLNEPIARRGPFVLSTPE